MQLKLLPELPPEETRRQPKTDMRAIIAWYDFAILLIGITVIALVVWLCVGCVAERKVAGGVYAMPQGEVMQCGEALRSSCGWTWIACGINRSMFTCMPKPEVAT